jgi:catechol 2,3-dioxygenase-like lactoylglutathione lyase family enzyme
LSGARGRFFTRDAHERGVSRLSSVTVLVDDLDRAREFYVDTVGCPVRDDFELPDGGRWLAVTPSDEPFPRLALVPADRDHPRLPTDPDDRPAAGRQTGDCPLLVFSVTDCRATVAELRADGVTVCREPEPGPGGLEAAVRDPWGNVYELVEPSE